MEQACPFGTRPGCGFMNNWYQRNTGPLQEVIIRQQSPAGMMEAIWAGVPASYATDVQWANRRVDLGMGGAAFMQTTADSAFLISNQLWCHL